MNPSQDNLFLRFPTRHRGDKKCLAATETNLMFDILVYKRVKVAKLHQSQVNVFFVFFCFVFCFCFLFFFYKT